MLSNFAWGCIAGSFCLGIWARFLWKTWAGRSPTTDSPPTHDSEAADPSYGSTNRAPSSPSGGYHSSDEARSRPIDSGSQQAEEEHTARDNPEDVRVAPSSQSTVSIESEKDPGVPAARLRSQDDRSSEYVSTIPQEEAQGDVDTEAGEEDDDESRLAEELEEEPGEEEERAVPVQSDTDPDAGQEEWDQGRDLSPTSESYPASSPEPVVASSPELTAIGSAPDVDFDTVSVVEESTRQQEDLEQQVDKTPIVTLKANSFWSSRFQNRSPRIDLHLGSLRPLRQLSAPFYPECIVSYLAQTTSSE